MQQCKQVALLSVQCNSKSATWRIKTNGGREGANENAAMIRKKEE